MKECVLNKIPNYRFIILSICTILTLLILETERTIKRIENKQEKRY